jgi:hypothetical protein
MEEVEDAILHPPPILHPSSTAPDQQQWRKWRKWNLFQEKKIKKNKKRWSCK